MPGSVPAAHARPSCIRLTSVDTVDTEELLTLVRGAGANGYSAA
jgi:hypothetical protein